MEAEENREDLSCGKGKADCTTASVDTIRTAVGEGQKIIDFMCYKMGKP